MTEETENLILKHLKRFESQMTRFESALDTVRSDMRVVKLHMAAFMWGEATQDEEIAAIKVQSERIGRRVELRDQRVGLKLVTGIVPNMDVAWELDPVGTGCGHVTPVGLLRA